ncbi:hypothetical protein FSP39_025391 [Pinctada imbricata]|uniref:G-protein coupled receptors family 1 profile domain-containing protein n=1 Tax=Pinctada imbricata TaxID=66713 RepID=A0AA88XP01_PINIB|nr:hypothetical protein FSP39_025391 [Pinctada imbricata]
MYVNRKNLGSQKRIKSDIYVISFLLAIVTVFSVCWMPLMTFIIKIINHPNPKTGKEGLLVIRLAISNSNIDPWIYIVLRKENLEFVERLFKRYVMRSEKPSQPSNTGTPKQGNVTLEFNVI